MGHTTIIINTPMPYRISKTDIENIADILPDAYVIEINDDSLDLVIKGDVDRKSAARIFSGINEDKFDSYRKERRQQFLDEVHEVRSFKPNVKKRVLCAIVNDAINSIV